MPLLGLVAAALAATAVAPPSASAWGRRGHHLVSELAVGGLPLPLRTFYRSHRSFVAEHAVDPDLWRQEDLPAEARAGLCEPATERPALEGGESPRHFIDADAVEPYPFREIPREFDRYREMAGERLPRWGTAPWVIEAYAELLSQAMRAGDRRAILCRSAILSHYVSDLAQPFHLTENYNGQLSGLEGIHFRFESDLVDAYADTIRTRIVARGRMGTVLDDPLEAAFAMLEDGYPAVDRLLLADLRSQEQHPPDEGAEAADDPAYLRAFWRRAGDVTVERLRYGVRMVASYWVTAWERAGRPDVETFDGNGSDRGGPRAPLR